MLAVPISKTTNYPLVAIFPLLNAPKGTAVDLVSGAKTAPLKDTTNTLILFILYESPHPPPPHRGKPEYPEKTLCLHTNMFVWRIIVPFYFRCPPQFSFFVYFSFQLSHADITFFDFLNNFVGQGKPEVPEQLSKFPKLLEHYKKVHDVPGIKAWIEKRPKTERWQCLASWYHRLCSKKHNVRFSTKDK